MSLEDNIEKQRQHYLYKRANELHIETKEGQLIKAAQKYPEPLEPDHWSALQCGLHAFQEIIDLEHYVTMQLIKNERLEATNEELRLKIADIDDMFKKSYERNKQANVRIGELLEENKELKQRLKEMEAAALRAIRKAYCYGR
jgi:hypothetical protein